MMANTWQGEFPRQNLELDGFAGTSPVKTSTRSATGSTTWPATCGIGRRTSSPRHPRTGRALLLCTAQPSGSEPGTKARGHEPGARHPETCNQGGSHLCPELLSAVPPAARQDESVDTRRAHLVPLHPAPLRTEVTPPINPSVSQSVWLVVVSRSVVVGGSFVSGRRRIRTSVGYAGDFTDRSLWPLGHPPWCSTRITNRTNVRLTVRDSSS